MYCNIVEVNTISNQEKIVKRHLPFADAIEKSKELENTDNSLSIFLVRYEHLFD